MGCRNNGPSEQWPVGIMGCRNNDLTPCIYVFNQFSHVTCCLYFQLSFRTSSAISLAMYIYILYNSPLSRIFNFVLRTSSASHVLCILSLGFWPSSYLSRVVYIFTFLRTSSALSQLYGTKATLEQHHFNHAVMILNSEVNWCIYICEIKLHTPSHIKNLNLNLNFGV